MEVGLDLFIAAIIKFCKIQTEPIQICGEMLINCSIKNSKYSIDNLEKCIKDYKSLTEKYKKYYK